MGERVSCGFDTAINVFVDRAQRRSTPVEGTLREALRRLATAGAAR